MNVNKLPLYEIFERLFKLSEEVKTDYINDQKSDEYYAGKELQYFVFEMCSNLDLCIYCFAKNDDCDCKYNKKRRAV